VRTRADSPTKFCTIEGCDHPLRARGLCSTHYNQQHQPGRHAAKPVDCAICGIQIMRPYSSNRRPACSVACRTQLQGGSATLRPSGYDWSVDAVHRARQAGATVIEPFGRDEIFRRDDWTCYLCKEPVNRKASPFHPDSPTIDHIMPLSKGGEHSKRNAATAHLRCNSIKQDRAVMIDYA
jgi:endogenous inhibitor of DNA gyrase (YacG/DUF329 family)